ncbi:SAVED domain-containing protein [Aliarcobacter butzleri]|uniref:SAVED domain-containing protein n=1 Tax=Aliarcobacter butzleri TaxID=28197 RepID=A0AAW7PVH8_9BACT|nr:Hachiman antiphage defense system protein HamA [Aliarcobacter butzleri]MDN5069475.1 SAVED domain-containing protein [Aliarcobacter butzleri]
MTEQEKLIGKHPTSEIFFDWCDSEDTVSTINKKHRKLSDKGIDRNTLIEKLSDWIIEHHTPPKQLERFQKKKSILSKHDFKEYVSKRMPFPIRNFTTQKGNLGEILLAEYLRSSSGLELLVYKLRFNPNVEQSMKGDDILLFDKSNIENKIIMGEAKYRTTPAKSVIDDIMDALSKDSLPISLPFVRDRLDELGEDDLADEVDDLISDVHKRNIPIVYVGFLHSNYNVSNTVETHLNTDNENLVLISYGEQNPENLIRESFDKAIEKIMR